ncbi:reverse transcriptase domain-containing protein [Francisella philomiragia]|nr:reverse transcriptase domain-containing protein [Francisella philomiragia]KFJ42220.1 reverse transcriptase family protein [Francisella philomiragia]
MNDIRDYLPWLQSNRKNSNHNSNYWHFKHTICNQPTNLDKINNSLTTGKYQFEPATVIYSKINREYLTIWSAKDSLVLKTIAESLKSKNGHIFSKDCVSNKNNGGSKQAFDIINKHIKTHKYIYRTDIKKFYNSINHKILLDKLKNFTSKQEYQLIQSHLDRIEWQDGEYYEVKQGISKSSPLSPVLGCIYLHELDVAMAKLDIIYKRFVDDFIIMAKTKHKLRKAVKIVKQILCKLKLVEHPDKTDYRNFNNQNAKSFDFLGVKISHKGVIAIKDRTKNNFVIKINQLYEYLRLILKFKNIVRVDTDLEIRILEVIIKQIKYFNNYYKFISKYFV